jgi:hypothetical protein
LCSRLPNTAPFVLRFHCFQQFRGICFLEIGGKNQCYEQAEGGTLINGIALPRIIHLNRLISSARHRMGRGLLAGWGGGFRKLREHPVNHGHRAARCGAKTRRGTPCQCPAMSNGRCRLHGVLSTGPKTLEGIERIRQVVTKHRRIPSERERNGSTIGSCYGFVGRRWQRSAVARRLVLCAGDWIR